MRRIRETAGEDTLRRELDTPQEAARLGFGAPDTWRPAEVVRRAGEMAQAAQPAKVDAPADNTRGVYEKFRVERTDGRSAPGEKHDGCAYFVLDLDHDPYAIPALRAYAEACAATHPGLSADVRKIVAARHPGPVLSKLMLDATSPAPAVDSEAAKREWPVGTRVLVDGGRLGCAQSVPAPSDGEWRVAVDLDHGNTVVRRLVDCALAPEPTVTVWPAGSDSPWSPERDRCTNCGCDWLWAPYATKRCPDCELVFRAGSDDVVVRSIARATLRQRKLTLAPSQPSPEPERDDPHGLGSEWTRGGTAIDHGRGLLGDFEKWSHVSGAGIWARSDGRWQWHHDRCSADCTGDCDTPQEAARLALGQPAAQPESAGRDD